MIRRIALGGIALALVAIALSCLVVGCTNTADNARVASSMRPLGAMVAPESARARSNALLPAVPGAHPGEAEELWVIQRTAAPSPSRDDVPTSPALYCSIDERRIPIPLRETGVSANVSGFVTSVNVTQRYHNPYDEKIEAVYVFPLPDNTAVNEFVMTIGDRRIRGIVRDRDEAQQIYNAAKSAGRVASLMSQERPNIFTQSVANIEPGKGIEIDIRYFGTVDYDDGWFEFVFPMVVGPRFNPGGSTTGIGAAPRERPGSTGQPTEVPYLAPNEHTGHTIALHATINAGVPIEELESVNHRIDVRRDSESHAEVSLAWGDTIPNKDFVLRWRVAGDEIRASMITSVDADGEGTFALMLLPPKRLSTIPRQPMELIFVIDCSGSMNGAPLEQCRDATRHALRSLRTGDTFQIIRFGNDASSFGDRLLPATRANVREAIRYVDNLGAGGGTHMVRGMQAALSIPGDPERLRFVCFMTDGYIGNETQVLSILSDWLGHARVFSFGVGSSPNRFLMNRMAKLGNGAVAYLSLNDDGGTVMDHFFDRASRPALADIELDFGGLAVSGLTPTGVSERLPDLFVGRPVLMTGRFDPATTTSRPIVARGRAGDQPHEITIRATHEDANAAALGAVWARQMIASLADQAIIDPGELSRSTESIRTLALDHGLISAFTSFVAVDASRVTDGTHGTTVAVPVPVPEGVRYETTVQGPASGG